MGGKISKAELRKTDCWFTSQGYHLDDTILGVKNDSGANHHTWSDGRYCCMLPSPGSSALKSNEDICDAIIRRKSESFERSSQGSSSGDSRSARSKRSVGSTHSIGSTRSAPEIPKHSGDAGSRKDPAA